MLDRALSSSSKVDNVAGEHDASVDAIVTIQATAMCRIYFLGQGPGRLLRWHRISDRLTSKVVSQKG